MKVSTIFQKIKKKNFKKESDCDIIKKVFIEGGIYNEAHKDIIYKRFKEIHEKRRLWRMSDILPVCM